MTAVEVPQHLRELAHANEVRLARVLVKRRLRAGEITFAAAIAEPCVQTMTVYALLASQHRWGRQRALMALRNADRYPISEAKLIGSLSARQRDELVFWVSP